MINIKQCVFIGLVMQAAVFAQMKNVPGESLILGHGEPVDGFQKAPLLTADNAEEQLQQHTLEFSRLDVPVIVWRYALQDKHTYMDRALETETMLIESNQSSTVIFSYKNPHDYMCAGIVNGHWYLGHCSGLDSPKEIQDTNTFKVIQLEDVPQVGTNYTFRVEILPSKCIFNVFENNKSVFKAVRTYPDGAYDHGSSGTAVYGAVGGLPVTDAFRIKRLFPSRTTFPVDTKPREMPPADVPPTTRI